MNPLFEKYNTDIKKSISEKFGIKNVMEIPKITKIVVNAGIGKEFRNSASIVEEMTQIISLISGQSPVVINSKLAISNFKLREGTPNGIKTTLRGEKMWDFLYKLINFTLPQVKDFRGVPRKSFDKRGNYSLGIKDHTIFPEIDPTKFLKLRSLQVVINTTAKDNEQALALLAELGMPFMKERK